MLTRIACALVAVVALTACGHAAPAVPTAAAGLALEAQKAKTWTIDTVVQTSAQQTYEDGIRADGKGPQGAWEVRGFVKAVGAPQNYVVWSGPGAKKLADEAAVVEMLKGAKAAKGVDAKLVNLLVGALEAQAREHAKK